MTPPSASQGSAHTVPCIRAAAASPASQADLLGDAAGRTAVRNRAARARGQARLEGREPVVVALTATVGPRDADPVDESPHGNRRVARTDLERKRAGGGRCPATVDDGGVRREPGIHQREPGVDRGVHGIRVGRPRLAAGGAEQHQHQRRENDARTAGAPIKADARTTYGDAGSRAIGVRCGAVVKRKEWPSSERARWPRGRRGGSTTVAALSSNSSKISRRPKGKRNRSLPAIND